MSEWFKNRRQEFIAATLRQFGQVRRQDLMREFDISQAQAANDIATFLSADPPHVRYDVSAKAYVVERPGDDMEERPFAYCCAEAGGHVDACDCVNKNHGTAFYKSNRR